MFFVFLNVFTDIINFNIKRSLKMAHVQLYDETAEIYDILELSGKSETPLTNQIIIDVLNSHQCQTVLDMTCGTGAQTTCLARSGFNVTGTDLSEGMLSVAKRKSIGLNIPYCQADMRSVSIGNFDAIISMYNAVGHLSREDFEKTIRNAAEHVKEGGVYIFDIFDRNLMALTPEYELIDSMIEIDGVKYLRFTLSKFDANTGKINFRQKTYIQKGLEKPTLIPDDYTLQTYSKEELKAMLLENGFDEAHISNEGMKDIGKIKGLVNIAIAKKSKSYTL